MMSSLASSSSCSQQQRSLQRERERYQRERQQVTISGGVDGCGSVVGGVPGELFLPGPTGQSAGSLFGEPIKKHQDDETSKRIKSTLGDFDHVQMYLRYDHKPLIGISTREITRINGNKAKIEQIFSEMKQTFQPLGALEDGESEGSHGTREEEEDDQEEEDEDDEDGDEDKEDEEEANESDSSSSSGSSSSSSSASNSTSSSTTDDDDDEEEDKDNNNKASDVKVNDSSGSETNINKKRKSSSGSSSSSSSSSNSSSSKNLPRSSPPQSEVSTWNLTNFMDKKTTASTTSVSSSNYVHKESLKVTNDSINDVIDKVARGELGEDAMDIGNSSRNHHSHQKHHHPPSSSEDPPPTKRRKKSNQPSQPQSHQLQHLTSPPPPPQLHLASPQPPPQQQQQTQHLPSPPPPLPPPQQHLPSPQPPPPPPQPQQSYHHQQIQHHQETTRQFSQESSYQREKTKITERAKKELNRNGNLMHSDKQLTVPKAPEKLLVSISLVLLKRIPGQSKESTNNNSINININNNNNNTNNNNIINSTTNNNSSITINRDSNLSADDYLIAAKKLKHAADRETDRTVQARKYLEAVLYFILTGNAMEQRSCGDLEKVFVMYKETLSLIRYISGKFAKSRTSTTEEIPTTDHKLTALSYRCQSLLCLKLSRLKEKEIRSNFKLIQSNIESNNINAKEKPSVTIPSQLFNAMNRQISLLQQLNNAHDLWQQADNLVDKNPSCAAFFATIDNECGSLSLSSSFDDLVRYVTTGLKILE